MGGIAFAIEKSTSGADPCKPKGEANKLKAKELEKRRQQVRLWSKNDVLASPMALAQVLGILFVTLLPRGQRSFVGELQILQVGIFQSASSPASSSHPS